LIIVAGFAAACAVAVALWHACVRSDRGDFRGGPLQADVILATYDPGHALGGLTVKYPFDEAVFPPEIIAPTFRWEDSSGESDAWLVQVRFPDHEETISVECRRQEWKPSESQWMTIQRRSLSSRAEVTVLGVRCARQQRIVSSACISIST